MSETQEMELYELPEQGASAQPAEPFGLAIQSTESAPRTAAAKWPPQQAAKADPKSKPQVDADGHRIVLIDDEIFTVVEGDLVLDVDQKGLWQETQIARSSQLTSRFRAEAVGLGEVALSEHGVVSSYLVGIVQDGKLVRWSPGTVLTYCVPSKHLPSAGVVRGSGRQYAASNGGLGGCLRH